MHVISSDNDRCFSEIDSSGNDPKKVTKICDNDTVISVGEITDSETIISSERVPTNRSKAFPDDSFNDYDSNPNISGDDGFIVGFTNDSCNENTEC